MKMTPSNYYTTLRSQWHYRPPVALMATLAWFCEPDEYWDRVQKISDWLETRLTPESSHIEHYNVLSDRQAETRGPLHMGEDDICADCTHLAYRLITGRRSDCQRTSQGSWPCRFNNDGNTVACPHFVPIGGTGDNYA